MANSRSNIFPIQLQGAELNLNKFDAEIKQYSGFNKNNSPFVGGCLSNVFTKDEVITGGNLETNYINKNGDIYTVDTEGLYLNDNKLISFPETTSFYKKTKLNVNKNVTVAISEDVYIALENNIYLESNNLEFMSAGYYSAYVVHWGNGNSQVLCVDYKIISPIDLNIFYKEGKICFTAKKTVSSGGTVRDMSFLIYVPDENDTTYYRYDSKTKGTLAPFSVQYDNNAKPGFANKQSVYFAENGIIFSPNRWFSNQLIFIDYDSPSMANIYFNTSFYTSSHETPVDCITNLFDNWYMTQEGILHFYYVKYTQSISIPVGMNNYVYRFKIEYDNTSFIISGTPDKKIYLSVSGSAFTINRTNIDGFTHPCGVAFCSQLYNSSDETKGYLLNFSGPYYNLFHTYTDNKAKIVGGSQILINGFKVLINNGVISNISILNMSYDSASMEWKPNNGYMGNLIADWAEVKELYIGSDYLIYQTYNNDFYRIEKTTPKITLKHDQIVVNSDIEQNAYSLTLKQVVHYAPDWNCSYMKTGIGVLYEESYMIGAYRDFTVADKFFVASGINEQSGYLKKNPSIILNMSLCLFSLNQGEEYPQSVIIEFVGRYGRYGSDIIKSLLPDNNINFYISPYSDNTAVYLGGFDYNMAFNVYNDNLAGLPFPNNTDGNVPYVPNIFSDFIESFGTEVFLKNDNNVYQLMKEGQENVMSFYLGTLIEGLDVIFIIQGQYYGIMNDQLFSFTFLNGVIAGSTFIVNIQGLQFCGNTPYEALFFSKTNRCLYSFTGANILSTKQFVDKIDVVKTYKYNPATQSIFLLTDIGVLVYSLFGIYQIDMPEAENIFLLNKGVVLCDNSGNYHYIKYYLDEGDTDYLKTNIQLETCFYGMNNQTVTINDCLYFRIFSEEHEEGELKVSATTISLSGRKTEETTFKINANDWDKITHTIYLRYQPKTQRGLGVSFSIDSPFKIASLSVGSQPDAILVDKISKGAINAPFNNTSSQTDW